MSSQCAMHAHCYCNARSLDAQASMSSVRDTDSAHGSVYELLRLQCLGTNSTSMGALFSRLPQSSRIPISIAHRQPTRPAQRDHVHGHRELPCARDRSAGLPEGGAHASACGHQLADPGVDARGVGEGGPSAAPGGVIPRRLHRHSRLRQDALGGTLTKKLILGSD